MRKSLSQPGAELAREQLKAEQAGEMTVPMTLRMGG
jgi:hypothetical protein